jgi:hypothetical protein
MDHLAQTDDIFFTGTNLEQDKAQQIVRQALAALMMVNYFWRCGIRKCLPSMMAG